VFAKMKRKEKRKTGGKEKEKRKERGRKERLHERDCNDEHCIMCITGNLVTVSIVFPENLHPKDAVRN